jgi:hypothetical protein
VAGGPVGGTGSAFAAIPAQNATGNWIKVVQRLPVRISLDPKELAQRPLRWACRWWWRSIHAARSGRDVQPKSASTEPAPPPVSERQGRLIMSSTQAQRRATCRPQACRPAGFEAPLTGGQLVGAGILLAAANFMAVLDTTIANVSVPTIAGALGASTSQGTWVITSYAVAEAITVPLTGWLAKRFGTVRVFILSMVCSGCSRPCAAWPIRWACWSPSA